MLKSKSDDDILIKQNRKSTLTDLQLEKWYESDIFTDRKLVMNLLNSPLSLMKF